MHPKPAVGPTAYTLSLLLCVSRELFFHHRIEVYRAVAFGWIVAASYRYADELWGGS